MRKELSPSLHGLFNAVADAISIGPVDIRFFQVFNGDVRTLRQTHSPFGRDVPLRLKSSIQLVSIVLGFLITVTAIISIIDLVRPEVIGRAAAFDDWRHYRILAAIILLVVIEWALLIALYAQIRLRRGLEMSLIASEERISFAAEAADIGLWRWDARSDRFWATEHCRRMFGLPDEAEYSLAAMREAIHPEDRDTLSKAVVESLKSNAVFEAETRIRLRGDEPRWVRIRAKSESNSRGAIAAISGTIVDISDHKRMEAQVERQERSLAHLARVGVIGELSGALAHELNQPLTAILSNAQAAQRLLERKPLDIDELRNAVSDIIQDDARAGDVIKHLRALLKNDDAGSEIVDLNAVVMKAVALTKGDLTARRVALITRLESSSLPVRGNAIQLQQLLINLIVNAADSMTDDVATSRALIIASDTVVGDTSHVSVSDTGPGIRASHMEKLFEPFFTTKRNGLGLGLAISRAIVARHGGRIWAENNPGHGATFHVSLPTAGATTS